MTTFQLRTIPIHNRSGSELELALEPEGDVIVLQPNAQCQIGADDDGSAVGDVEFEYEVGRLTVHASCRKRVSVDGTRVR